MSKMKLCEKVKDVLDVACPMWMEKLCAINFDITKLESTHDSYLIRSDYAHCFIGEIHTINGKSDKYDYQEYGTRCNQCTEFAEVVPKIFTSRNPNTGKTELYSRIVRVGRKRLSLRNGIAGRKKLLKLIADHIKTKHPHLLNKPKIENDC